VIKGERDDRAIQREGKGRKRRTCDLRIREGNLNGGRWEKAEKKCEREISKRERESKKRKEMMRTW